MPNSSTTASLHRVFTYALRAGSIMARNGAPAATVTHTLLAVARTFGHPRASASVTMDQLTLSEISPDQDRTISLSQSVGSSGFHLMAISEVEATTKDVIRGDLNLDEGLRRLEAIERADLGHHPGLRLVGWSLMAAGFAVLLGAGWVSILLAALTALLIEAVSSMLAGQETPLFFTHVVAGALATTAAVIAVELTPGQSPGLIITAALVSKLAGGAALGAAQDILTGWYLTATARVIEAVLVTTGLVVGVLAALAVALRFGISLSIDQEPQAVTGLLVIAISAVLIGGGFAVASQSPWSRVPVICALSAGAAVLSEVLGRVGLSQVSSLGMAAAALGGVAVLGTRWIKLPPSGVLGVALAPLLPGMQIYLGFVGLTNEDEALPHFFLAAVLAMALGTGIVLGEYLASQMLWRGMQARRLGEQKLHGEATTEARQLTAEWLSTPLFKRPFLVEDFQPAKPGGETPTGELRL